MDAFTTKTYTVRQLFKNELEESDRGKNYYIPPSQRKYDWNEDEVIKLIRDISDEANQKIDGKYNPYFIGGIVLSQQSMAGEEQSQRSLEVIDGQQRLSSLVLILSSLVQIFRFKRETLITNEVAQHLINDISKILISRNLNTFEKKVEEKYIVERSDELSDDFKKIIYLLINNNIEPISNLKNQLSNNVDSQKLARLVNSIVEEIQILDDEDLIEFTLQLLNNTWMVVTKTNSIETGFFIFEKLNDSGILLKPEDLLKNYLFRTTSNTEYDQLTEEWKSFLKNVQDINPTRTKLVPRDFLEQYLVIVNKAPVSSNKEKKRHRIFAAYKQLHEESFEASLQLLDDLNNIALEYGKIKRMPYAEYINVINFQLGYLIILSFYKKFPDEYESKINEILSMIVRLGITFLIMGKSTALSSLVPSICSLINNEGNDINQIIAEVKVHINEAIIKRKDDFIATVSSSNLFRKKQISKLILKLIEFHISGKKFSTWIDLVKLMPTQYNDNCIYQDISEDNSAQYSNYIGNLLLDDNLHLNDKSDCFEERYSVLSTENTLDVNDINKCMIFKDNNYITTDCKLEKEEWGKNYIIKRSQMIADVATKIIIEDNFESNFFS